MKPSKDPARDFSAIYEEYYSPERVAQRRQEARRKERINNNKKQAGL